jgi:hypothetical protein
VFLSRKVLKFQKQKIGEVKKYKGQMKKKTKMITNPVFNVVHVADSLVFCVVFCRSLFLFSVDYCIACFSSIEGFPLHNK